MPTMCHLLFLVSPQYTCMHTYYHVHTGMFPNMREHTYTHMQTYVCTHTCVSMYAHTCIHTYACTHTCMHTNERIHMCAHANACTFMHTHAFMHTQTYLKQFYLSLRKFPQTDTSHFLDLVLCL